MKKGLFVISFLFLAVMCWKLLTGPQDKHPPVLYSDFLQALDTGKIKQVSIYMGYTDADLKFVRKDFSSAGTSNIGTRELPNLIKKMVDDGVSVEFATARKASPAEFFLNFVPLLLLILVVGYFYFIRSRKKA